MSGITIKTEVDSLVSLVNTEGRISVKDAARKLGVPVGTISEWAAFLEEDNVILREVYNQVPPKVEYSLTEYGWSLKGILDSLCSWGEQHIEKNYPNKEDVLIQPKVIE